MALMRDGVWSIANSTETQPTTNAAEIAKYAGRRDKALATIVLSVDPSLLYLIGDPQDPVAVWKKLEEQFQKKTYANKRALRRKLHACRLKENESIQDHIKTMVEIFNELAIIGEELSNKDRVVYLLASLPESYNTLVTALEAHEKVREMEVVTERLLNEERKQKDHETTTSSDGVKALVVRRQGRKVRSSIKCYRCHKVEHIQRNCTETITSEQGVNNKPWKSHQPENKSKWKQSINTAEVFQRQGSSDSDQSSDFGLVPNHVLSAKEGQPKPSKGDYWIVNSGATCHICNNKEMFTNLVPMKQPQTIILGDGKQLEANSQGTVELQGQYITQPNWTM